jgi:hypothetical protein
MAEFGPGRPLHPESITAEHIRAMLSAETFLSPLRRKTPRRWEYTMCWDAARAATVAKRSLNAELRPREA